MLKVDEDALMCDMAETYRIIDFRALPLTTAALFASGLRETSRIKRKMAGIAEVDEIILLAAAVDRLSIMLWQNTEDGQKGKNPPKSVLDDIMGKTERVEKVVAFESGIDFEREWALLQGGGLNGN